MRVVWHLFMSWPSPIESKRPSTHRHALRDTDPTKNPSRCCQAVFLECRNAAVRNQNCHSCRGTVNISYLSVQPFSGNDVTSFLFTETVRFFPRGSPSVDRRSFSPLSEIFFFFQGRVIGSGGMQAILKSSCVLTHDLQWWCDTFNFSSRLVKIGVFQQNSAFFLSLCFSLQLNWSWI